jgi:hypothetical protein
MFWGSRNRLRPPDVIPWRSAHHSITRLIAGCLRFFTLIQCLAICPPRKISDWSSKTSPAML